MSCCLASSRENTRTFDGRPSSPLNRRRTTVRPSEPVPPVTSTCFPSNCIEPPVIVVRRWVLREGTQHFPPRWWRETCRFSKPRAIQTPVDDYAWILDHRDLETKCVPERTEESVLVD